LLSSANYSARCGQTLSQSQFVLRKCFKTREMGCHLFHSK
jgi:hypothetical protein